MRALEQRLTGEKLREIEPSSLSPLAPDSKKRKRPTESVEGTALHVANSTPLNNTANPHLGALVRDAAASSGLSPEGKAIEQQ
jgi:hypothetical protein